MSVIWKFMLPGADGGIVSLPAGASPVSAGWQGSDLFIWVACPDPKAELIERMFKVVGTGQNFDEEFSCAYHVRHSIGGTPLELFVFEVLNWWKT